MKQQQRFIFALVASAAVLIVWNYLFPPVPPPPPNANANVNANQQVAASLAAIDSAGICPRFAGNHTATDRDRDTFVRATSGFADADTRGRSAAQDSRRHSAL